MNRRVTTVFLLLSVLILTAVPFLIREQEQTPIPIALVEVTDTAAETEPETAPWEGAVFIPEGPGRLLNYDAVGEALQYLLFAVLIIIVIMIVFAVISALRAVIGSKSKHSDREEETEWEIERLESAESPPDAESAAGYERKLRRRYEKLIRSRTEQDARLEPLTPAELGEAAELRGPAAETVRELYEQTRYGPEPADKDRYSRFKQALHSLPPRKKTEK